MRHLVIALFAWLIAVSAEAAEATLAVASSMLKPVQDLAEAYAWNGGHRFRLASGATGNHYAQIVRGAPFDALIAADADIPRRLENEGHGVVGSRFAYGIGRLVLWSADPARIQGDASSILTAGNYRRLAVAHPELAPYGRAARELLESLGLWQRLADRLATGQNIGQAFQMAESGAAELALVALAQARSTSRGAYQLVPAARHAPIVHEAILLKRGAGNPAAVGFLEFLTSPPARAVLDRFGYEKP